jgi:hypothetical protein
MPIPRNSNNRVVLSHKFCPFCSCEHFWYKEDSKFLAAASELGPGVRQAG